MKLNPKTQDFIERIGLTIEKLGTTRTLGRMFGLLLVAERPLSFEKLASALRASKASISTNVRVCVQIGLAQRVSILRDRRDHYEISPGSFERAVAVRFPIIQEMVTLADAGMQAVAKGNHTARARLKEMRDFDESVGAEMAKMMPRWQDSRKPTTSRKRQR